MRILLVEDHPDTKDVLTRMLRKLGCDVDPAATVAEAKAVCNVCGFAFDLLICDIGLPDGDGWELMRYIRKYSAVPGIALTGYGMGNDVIESESSGYAVHLTKPLRFDQLIAAVRDVAGAVCDEEQPAERT